MINKKITVHEVSTSLGQALSNEYDEEHLVESSSSETSPRDYEISTSDNVTDNRYSRYNNSWTSQQYSSGNNSWTQSRACQQSSPSQSYYSSITRTAPVDGCK